MFHPLAAAGRVGVCAIFEHCIRKRYARMFGPVSVTLGRRRLDAAIAVNGLKCTKITADDAVPDLAHAKTAVALMKATVAIADETVTSIHVWRNELVMGDAAIVQIWVPMVVESIVRSTAGKKLLDALDALEGVVGKKPQDADRKGPKTAPGKPDLSWSVPYILNLVRKDALMDAVAAEALRLELTLAPADLPPDFAPLRPSERCAGVTAGGVAVHYRANFLNRLTARVGDACRPGGAAEIPWKAYTFIKFGRECKEHKTSAFFGDPGTGYTYLKQRHPGRPWAEDKSGALQEMLWMVRRACGHPFNFVLCNWYEGPRNSLGAHSDDTTDLVPGTSIASVSVGLPRPFVLEPKTAAGAGDKTATLLLASGSLANMGPGCQKYLKHSVPPVAVKSVADEEVTWRLNFTFRCVAVLQPLATPLRGAADG